MTSAENVTPSGGKCCGACRHANVSIAKYCSRCGAPLPKAEASAVVAPPVTTRAVVASSELPSIPPLSATGVELQSVHATEVHDERLSPPASSSAGLPSAGGTPHAVREGAVPEGPQRWARASSKGRIAWLVGGIASISGVILLAGMFLSRTSSAPSGSTTASTGLDSEVRVPPASQGSVARSGGPIVSYFVKKPAVCEWRHLDPALGRDVLFLELPESPTEVWWSAQQGRVWFLLGSKLFTTEWPSARAVDHLLDAPETFMRSGLRNIWLDETDGHWWAWNVLTADVAGTANDAVELWKFDPAAGKWMTVERIDTGLAGEIFYGSGNWPKVLEGKIHPWWVQRSLTIESRMSLGGQMQKTKQDIPDSMDEQEVRWPLASRKGALLLFKAGFGDSWHAMGPVSYIPREGAAPIPLYEDEVSFEEKAGFLLFGSRTSPPKLIDLTQAVVREFPEGAFHALWVERK